MLRFAKGPQPTALTAWQATPSASWGGFSSSIWPDILRDQGDLCAYCQRRIPANVVQAGVPAMHVEHWVPQSAEGPDMLRRDMQWTNLLGVCPGDEGVETGGTRGERHCDTSRGNAPLFLHPVEGQGADPTKHLSYTAEGEVRPHDGSKNAAQVQADIDALNLCAHRLRRARKEVLSALRIRLERLGWSQGTLRREHQQLELRPGAKTPEHCEVARHFLRRWARRNGWNV
ncbi:MAG: TIGR02646 family protein [Myxococcales bacterium]|nr:TIGR02646 family protein [Myxococcales bacterium]